MKGFLDRLNDISDVLDDVSAATDIANHGLKKTKESGENISRIARRIASGDNERDRKKIMEYAKRKNACVRRTSIFCILMIIITVLLCVFV